MSTSILLVLSGLVHAWEVKTNNSGEELHWGENQIHFSINADGDHGLSKEELEAAIVGASSAWAQGDVNFVHDGNISIQEFLFQFYHHQILFHMELYEVMFLIE